MIATLLVLVLGGIAMYMITKNLPTDTTKFSYTEEEDTEVLDLPKTENEEYQDFINKFLEKGSKERGMTVEEYSEQIVKEEMEEERKRKERWSA